ncbi:FCS-Like Zinc finger 8-like [Zingiber officinale]|nr:FCS-Like Zinc finger 8-like [Zingiber officinale]
MQRERSIRVAGKPSPSSSHADTKGKNLSSPLFLFPNLNPTSILEPKRSPFSKRPPKAPLLELQSEPIGLAILDALVDDKENGKMVLFGSQLKVRIPSMESLRSPIEFGVKNKESQLALVSPGRPLSPAVTASATELETLESYTCVISRGSNPKTTHIFDDCVLESCGDWRSSIYSTQEEQH